MFLCVTEVCSKLVLCSQLLGTFSLIIYSTPIFAAVIVPLLIVYYLVQVRYSSSTCCRYVTNHIPGAGTLLSTWCRYVTQHLPNAGSELLILSCLMYI